MKTSVVLCAFNGELFLKEQLYSIIKQTVLPDEIVIVNDCSIDNTDEIVKDFQDNCNIPFTYVVNSKNLGVLKSFSLGVDLAKNEIIIFSDQDDIWLSTRIERTVKEFHIDNSLDLFFSNGAIIDSNSNILKGSLFKSFGFNFILRVLFKISYPDYVLTKKFIVTGATMAVKASFAKRHYSNGVVYLHDMYLSSIAAHLRTIKFSCDKLIQYRLHNQQSVGVISKKDSKKIYGQNLDVRKDYLAEISFLKTIQKILDLNYQRNARFVQKKVIHRSKRISIRDKSVFKRFILVQFEFLNLNYFLYSHGLKSYFRDLFLP